MLIFTAHMVYFQSNRIRIPWEFYVIRRDSLSLCSARKNSQLLFQSVGNSSYFIVIDCIRVLQRRELTDILECGELQSL